MEFLRDSFWKSVEWKKTFFKVNVFIIIFIIFLKTLFPHALSENLLSSALPVCLRYYTSTYFPLEETILLLSSLNSGQITLSHIFRSARFFKSGVIFYTGPQTLVFVSSIPGALNLLAYIGSKTSYGPVCPTVGGSFCHNFPKGREVSRSTFLLKTF